MVRFSVMEPADLWKIRKICHTWFFLNYGILLQYYGIHILVCVDIRGGRGGGGDSRGLLIKIYLQYLWHWDQVRRGMYRYINKARNMYRAAVVTYIPVNTRRSSTVGSMLGQRLRRWPSIEPTIGERLVFSAIEKFGHRFCIFLSESDLTLSQHC